jgi:hypothetical protein
MNFFDKRFWRYVVWCYCLLKRNIYNENEEDLTTFVETYFNSTHKTT